MTDNELIETMRESTIRRVIGPTILLGSGSYFDFEDPAGSEITIEDIAYGLAFEGRNAGQSFSRILQKRVFYSVAEHCVRMSLAVPQHLALSALMHEVGEAVCGDMNAPLKSMNPSFKAVEKRCEAAILEKFGVAVVDPVEIKRADLRMLATERRDLLPWKGERWGIDDLVQPVEPYPFEIIPWSPEAAAQAFLTRYAYLANLPSDEEQETCIACEVAFMDGDLVYPDAIGGSIHAECCGPEIQSFTGIDGQPLKEGDEIPKPYRWSAEAGRIDL